MLQLLLLAALAGPARAASDSAQRRATVEVDFVSRAADWRQPWQRGPQGGGSGSGVIIAGHRVLTNAHVVSDAVYLAVRKAGDVKRYTARVEFVAHDGELALLTVEDPDFFAGTEPVSFGELPAQRDRLAVYGFPTGGSELSITEGVVSRVGVVTYAHSGRKLLAIQTDAAINPGNSGGPVFQGGKLVGLAFQHLAGHDAQSIGYLIPIPLIRRFLDDVKDGRYDGIPAMDVFWQETENPALRRAYGLTDDGAGVLIDRVEYGSAEWDVLKPGDVLVKLGGVSIGLNGTVPLRGDERVDFGDLVARRQIGEVIEAEVVRARQRLTLPIKLKPSAALVPGPRHDVQPAYLIMGGLVFQPLTEDLLRAYGGGTDKLRSIANEAVGTPERRQAVVLSQVLADEVNRGYHGWGMLQVVRLNGRSIGDMKDLVAAVSAPVDGRHVVEFENGSYAVLDASGAAKALPAILTRCGAGSDRSPDLR